MGPILPADFALNISSADPNNISGSHILQEITLKGQTFGDFIAPDSYSASYNNVNATGRVYLSDHTVNSYDYYNNPSFSDQIMPSFQSRDLNYYHAMDNSNYTADHYTLSYDSPITSTGDVTLIITERNGNNPYFVEALDADGVVLGDIAVNLSDYVDSGHKVNNYQSGGMFVALFPIDDIAPLGSKVSALRMTFPGASSDGPDGKVFFFGDFSSASCDSDSDGIPNQFDLDSDNDGIYDAVEAGHNQAHTNGRVNGGYGANGLADNVETSAESDIINYSIRNTDSTASADYLDSDSDGDGCNDANEAYANASADGDANGFYGTGSPPIVNNDGTVTSASYTTPADGDTSGTPDYREAEVAPIINTQPTDESICEDGDTSFTVVASNVDTYQWQYFNGSSWENLTDSGIYSGSNSGQLNITNAQNSHNGNQYRVIVSNSSYICRLETSNTVLLTVVQPAAPTSGGDQEACAESPVQTLTATATPPAGSNVVWFDAATAGNVVANPTLSSVGTITYFAESQENSTGCPSATRTPVSLTIQPRPTITVSDSPSCVFRLFQPTTYELAVTVSSGTVNSTAGTVTNTSGNEWEIVDVPSGTDIIVTVTDANGCTEDLPVTAPNCSCPVVDAPASGGNQSYCSGDTVPTITASVGLGQTIDWYDSPSGGTLLLLGSASYTPSGPGTYYAEARNTTTNCKSATRTAITVTEDAPSTATIGPDQTVWVKDDAVFTVSTANADTYQWQVSIDGGIAFNNIVNGVDYVGTQSTALTVKSVEVDKNGFRYRLLASKSGSSCPSTASSSALLTVRVKTVITNRRITHRVKKN